MILTNLYHKYKHKLPLFIIVSVGTFLLSFRLSELMMFIGDFGWFYLAAKQMLESGSIPLVGIPSSHPWLHQGPLWTYLLGGSLWLSNYNPLSGAVLGVLFGISSIILMYEFASSMYNKRVGLLAAALYATSPLIIIHARMPYHTSPIPFFTLLFFYGIYRWVHGSNGYLSVALFSLGILYNLELATVVYIPLLIAIVLYGLYRKQAYSLSLRQPKQWLIPLIAAITPMIPILLYDLSHGFPQTVRFVAWIGYKILTVFGYPPLHPEIQGASYPEVLFFFFQHLQKLLFLPNFFMGFLILFVALLWFIRRIISRYRNREYHSGDILLGLFLIVGLGGFFATKTMSEAYLPMLFPSVILLVALLFYQGIMNRFIFYFAAPFCGFLLVSNVLSLLSSNYLMALPVGGYGPTYAQRVKAADYIVNTTKGKQYTIEGEGTGKEFPSYLMSYEYLLWYLGNEPQKNGTYHFFIEDTPTTILLGQYD